MKLKIENKTKYDTQALRRLLRETLRRNEKIEGRDWLPDKGDKLHILITSAHRRAISGMAYDWPIRIVLRLPIDPLALNPCELALVFEHELNHVRGYRHNRGDMKHLYTNDMLKSYHWAYSFLIPKAGNGKE